MNQTFRRTVTTSVTAAALVAFGAGPAAAHFCFKTELQERAAAGMAGSSNWMTFASIAEAEIPGICPAAIAYIADAAGATPQTLINGHGTMAGGTLRKGPDAGNKAISHLDFGALEAAIPAGLALC